MEQDIQIENLLSEQFCRKLVSCIDTALNDDVKRYVQEFNTSTTNGLPHLVWDFINTNLERNFGDEFQVLDIKRLGWTGKILLNHFNKLAFTLMRVKRLKQLSQSQEENQHHYLPIIVSVLNGNLKGKYTQTNLFSFDEENYVGHNEEFNKLFSNSIPLEYQHALVVFDSIKGQLSEVRVLILGKKLNIVNEYSLNEYIQPNYDQLLNNNLYNQPNKNNDIGSINKSRNLVKLREKPVLKTKGEE